MVSISHEDMTIVKFLEAKYVAGMSVASKAQGRHHHGALRRALLDAVSEIVLEKGPEHVTLRGCARRAGVSHSAATPHFGDKRGLLTAFATEGETRLAAAMRAMLDALPESAGAEARLAATGRGYIAFAQACPAHFRLMFRTDLIDPTDPVWRVEAERPFSLLVDAMQAVAPELDARARRARLTLAWASVHGYCTLRAEDVGGELWEPEERAAEVAEDLISLIVAACAAPGHPDSEHKRKN